MLKNAAEITTIAIGLFERGFVRAALGTLSRGVNQYPDSARIWEMHGILLQSEEKFSEAEFALETASMLAPLSMAGEFALAACYLVSGHLKAACAIYEHLLNVQQVPTSRLAELAAGFSRCGQYHLALAVCRRGAERDPECDEAIYGMAHYMGRLCYPAEQILPLLQKAVDLAPHVSQYRLALVGWYARLGCFRFAHQHLEAISPEVLEAIPCTCCLNRLIQVCQEMKDENMLNRLNSYKQNATKNSC